MPLHAMSENRRIVVNIAATYGRSLFSLVCSVFTGRWVLMALGETDYGLMGVVGGLLAFLAFVNNIMSGGTGRFYALALGRERSAEDKAAALEDCRRWFSLAVSVHLTMAVLFVLIAYPAGEWAVRHFLVIPADRLAASIEVFRLSCLACFVGMVTLPFSAMYVAKQEIAEVTFFALAVTVFVVVLSWFMVTHPGDWMVPYARWTCASAILPCLVYAVHGYIRFPECRVRLSYMRDRARLREFLKFVAWGCVGPLGVLLRIQGAVMLVNRFFGPAVNASWALARSVSEKSNTFSASIKGAMVPAVVQACGAGDDERMKELVFRMCKFAAAASLFVALPLLVELPAVLRLWLKTPPPFLVGLAVCTIVEYVIGCMTSGYDTAVYAKGRLALYQSVAGFISLMTLPVLYIVHRLGGGVYAIGVAACAVTSVFCLVRVVLASYLVGTSVREWIVRLAAPLAVSSMVALGVAMLPRLFMPPGLARIFCVVAVAVAVHGALTWRLLLDAAERTVVVNGLRRRFGGAA